MENGSYLAARRSEIWMSCLRQDNKHYIYKITNLINNKVYIGKTSRTVKERFEEHLQASKKDTRPLYNAMRKYGVENFKVKIIEVCSSNEEANEREMYWIKKYNSFVEFENSNGYNCTLGGDGMPLIDIDLMEVVKHYLEHKNTAYTAEYFEVSSVTVRRILYRFNIEIQDYNNEKTIVMIKNGKIIKKFNSIADAYRFLGESPRKKNIYNALNTGRRAFGYHWKYLNCEKTKLNKRTIVMRKNGKNIKYFSTHTDAYLYLNKSIKSRNITKVLNGELKTAFGFEWGYADEYMSNENNQVLMVKNGKIMGTFLTLKEAYVNLGKNVKSSNISKVLKGQRKTAYGYEWHYANDFIGNLA